MANEVMTPADIVKQAIADGELHTTKPVNRALLALLEQAKGMSGSRIVDKHGRLAMDEDDLSEFLDPVAHCDKEWPNDAPHRWE